MKNAGLETERAVSYYASRLESLLFRFLHQNKVYMPADLRPALVLGGANHLEAYEVGGEAPGYFLVGRPGKKRRILGGPFGSRSLGELRTASRVSERGWHPGVCGKTRPIVVRYAEFGVALFRSG